MKLVLLSLLISFSANAQYKAKRYADNYPVSIYSLQNKKLEQRDFNRWTGFDKNKNNPGSVHSTQLGPVRSLSVQEALRHHRIEVKRNARYFWTQDQTYTSSSPFARILYELITDVPIIYR